MNSSLAAALKFERSEFQNDGEAEFVRGCFLPENAWISMASRRIQFSGRLDDRLGRGQSDG